MAQEGSGEETRKEKDEEFVAKKDAQVVAEERLEEINLGPNPQEPRPISISSRMSGKEKSKLILLLKKFKDVFAWDYNEMSGLD